MQSCIILPWNITISTYHSACARIVLIFDISLEYSYSIYIQVGWIADHILVCIFFYRRIQIL